MPTNYNRANLITESSTLFPDNNTQEISPADLRQWLEDGTTSFVTQKDKSTLEESIYEAKASTLVAGSTVNLASASGNYLHISGTGTINSFGTCPAGARFVIVFDAAATLTYNATSLIIPGLANKTAAAGDCCMIVSEGSGNWRIVGYFAISGGGGGGSVTAVTGTAPIASSGGTAPDISIPKATALDNGYLDSADWTTFNGKQDTLSAGTGISIISNVVANTAPDQTVSLASGTGINVTGTYPSFTIANTAPSSGGTVTTTGSPSSGQITKFSGATSITNATAGTDYIAPPSGTAILKANSGGALANATAGTDYIAPPSGTSILKANSGGALANASAGTDYVAPGAATGSGLTMATSRLLGRTTASTGAIEEITVGSGLSLSAGSLSATGSGSGTVNSGTANRLTYYATTGTAVSELPTAGSSGQILQSNGTGSAPSWVAAPAATMTIGSSVVSGATAGRLLLTTTSGANQVLNQDSNLNYDTTNDRLGIGVASPTATLHLAAGVAANPQMLLVPSSVTPTGTTNGSIWCNTVSSNTRLTMYKDSALTNLITLDRNPDLATSGSGIVQADANGTLSKGADLTALGIYAQTNSIIAITTGSGSLIGTVTGVTALPTNFFGVGKTIETKFSGLITMPNGSPVCTIDFKVTDGTTTSTLGTLVYDSSNMTGRVYMVNTQVTCRTTGAGATFGVSGQMIVNHTGKSQETVFITPGSVAISGSLTTASALTLQVVVTWTGTAGGSIDTRTHFCNYIN